MPTMRHFNSSRQPEKIHLYSYTCFMHSSSKFYRKTKQNTATPSRQNILTYQNDVFQFACLKTKLAYCHRNWGKGCVLHFTTNKTLELSCSSHWRRIFLTVRDHMAPICLEHHLWRLHVGRTQAWAHPCSFVLLQSEVRQCQKISSFSDPLNFAYTTAVTIHKLAFFLLVALLIKLVTSTKLVSSV